MTSSATAQAANPDVFELPGKIRIIRQPEGTECRLIRRTSSPPSCDRRQIFLAFLDAVRHLATLAIKSEGGPAGFRLEVEMNAFFDDWARPIGRQAPICCRSNFSDWSDEQL